MTNLHGDGKCAPGTAVDLCAEIDQMAAFASLG
jgi:hypothetical protein